MQDQYKNLTPRREEILEMHTKQGKTMEKIGGKPDIIRERIRQNLIRLEAFKEKKDWGNEPITKSILYFY